jgi:VanZ family protein
LKKYLLRTPAIFLTILIFVVSSFSLDKIPARTILTFDKLIHFVVYAFYTFSVAMAFSTSKSKKLKSNLFLIALFIGLAYGALDEIHQLFVGGRSASIYDWIADALGSLVGVYLYSKLSKYQWLSYDPTE